MDSAIHRINLYPVDNAIDFPNNTYPLDSAIQRLNNRSLVRSAQFFNDLDLPPFQNNIRSACCSQ